MHKAFLNGDYPILVHLAYRMLNDYPLGTALDSLRYCFYERLMLARRAYGSSVIK
jgi:hypothetical protein